MEDDFHAFGATHAIVVTVAVVGWIAVIRHARRVRHTAKETVLRRSLAAFIGVTVLANTVYELRPGVRDLAVSLPLHLCDFAWFCAAVSLWRGDPRTRLEHALLVYWGLGLSSWAFATPVLAEGPARLRFWLFWTSHWQIVGASLLAVLAWDVRPDWGHCRRAVIVTFLLFVAVTGVNVVADTNYFFSGRNDVAGPVAMLGEWPGRLAWLVLVVLVIFVAMTAAFRALEERERRGEASGR